MSTDLVKF